MVVAATPPPRCSTPRTLSRPQWPGRSWKGNQFILDTGEILTALDLTNTTDEARLERQLQARKELAPRGEDPRRAAGGHR